MSVDGVCGERRDRRMVPVSDRESIGGLLGRHDTHTLDLASCPEGDQHGVFFGVELSVVS